MTITEYAAMAGIASALITVGFLVFGKVYGFGVSMKTLESAAEDACDKKIEAHTQIIGEAMRAFREALHLQEVAALKESRLIAETYMRRDSYYIALSDLKKEISGQFDKMDDRLDKLQDMVMWSANPQGQQPPRSRANER